MDFSDLRHARERLGLSLRDIAERTKIRTSILGAIENNEVDHLPPPIFTRGFVKAYAREVGLDPQAFAETVATPQPLAAAASDVRAIESAFEDRSERYNLSERETSSLVTAALIIVAGLLFILTDPWKSSTDNTAAAEATATDGTAIHGSGGDDRGKPSARCSGAEHAHRPCAERSLLDRSHGRRGARDLQAAQRRGSLRDRGIRGSRPQGRRSRGAWSSRSTVRKAASSVLRASRRRFTSRARTAAILVGS